MIGDGDWRSAPGSHWVLGAGEPGRGEPLTDTPYQRANLLPKSPGGETNPA